MFTSSTNWKIKTVFEDKRQVGGLITCQRLDKDGEELDYDASKPEFQKWSQEAYDSTVAAGQEPSYGNIREQHSKRMVGKFIEPLKFDDEKKTIWGLAKIYDDDVWSKTKDGGYTGFSPGGQLVGKPRKVGGKTVFVLSPREVSIVDNPAGGDAHFDFVRTGGVTVQKMFKCFEGTIYEQIENAVASFSTTVSEIVKVAKVAADGANAMNPDPKIGDPAYAPDALPDQNVKPSQPVEIAPEATKTVMADPIQGVTTDNPFGDSDTQLGRTDSEPQADYIVKVSPPGWSNTVEAMKEHPEITNPYALAWYMEGEGYTPHKMTKAAAVEFMAAFNNDIEKRAVADKERSDLADEGKAMPDGSYPIANASDLSNAVQAFGRHPTDAVKEHIKHRAHALGRTDLLPDKWEKAAGAEKIKLSTVKVGDENMSKETEVQKAARLSMASHLQNLKGHMDKCKAAVDGAHAAIHDCAEKCMKLAGNSESLDQEHTDPIPDNPAATDVQVKAAKAEVEKLAGQLKTLTEQFEAMKTAAAAEKTAAEAREKAAQSRITDDPATAKETGVKKNTVDKVAQAVAKQKEFEANLEIAKAAFGGPGKTANGALSDDLYYKLTNARAYRAAHPIRVGAA